MELELFEVEMTGKKFEIRKYSSYLGRLLYKRISREKLNEVINA